MRGLLLSLLLLTISGCAGKDRLELLTDRADAYNRSIRWSSLTAASNLIIPESRRTLMNILADDMAKRRIVDFSIVDLSVDDKKMKGSVVVEVSFYNLSDQNLQYRQEVQTWEYLPKEKNWFLTQARSLN